MDDEERKLKMEMWKMTPKFLIGHMVDRDSINSQRTPKRSRGKGEGMALSWVWGKLPGSTSCRAFRWRCLVDS